MAREVTYFCVFMYNAVYGHSAGSTTQNNKTETTYNSTTIELLYY